MLSPKIDSARLTEPTTMNAIKVTIAASITKAANRVTRPTYCGRVA
jgi:hypothetical protein